MFLCNCYSFAFFVTDKKSLNEWYLAIIGRFGYKMSSLTLKNSSGISLVNCSVYLKQTNY
jgi:hypothetical protein